MGGQERARLTGELTHRRLLRNTLQVVYDDDRSALDQLRRQMNSSTEMFPQGPLGGRIGHTQKRDLLGTLGLFAGLNKRQLGRLARLAEERRGPGECFGEMSLLDDEPRSARVVTTQDTTQLAIHRGDFDRHLLARPL